MNPRELVPGMLSSLNKSASVVETIVKETASRFNHAAAYAIDIIDHAKKPATTESCSPPLNATTKPADSSLAKTSNIKKKGRTRTDCSANITASLSLEGEKKRTLAEPSMLATGYAYLLTGAPPPKYVDDSLDIPREMAILEADLKKEIAKGKEAADAGIIEALQLRKVELVKDQIIEHAARRADLFFYLLIAVYDKNVTACKDETTKQHGKGSEERGTAGCHSSLFPGIKFTYNHSSQPTFFNKQPSGECPLLEDTYFAEALNATVELPMIVNDFDGHLEGRAVKRSFIRMLEDTLNKVSTKKITPIEGMNEFYNVMNKFFIVFEEKYLSPHKKTIENYKAHKKICEYQREGTFSGADPKTLETLPAHYQMMLKINSYKDIFSYDYYYKAIQNEILNTKIDKAAVKTTKP